MKRPLLFLTQTLLILFPMIVTSCSTESFSSSEESVSTSLSSQYQNPLSGIYVKTSNSVEGVDTLDQYVFSTLTLRDDGTSLMEDLDAFGLTSQEGTFTVADPTVNVLVGLKTYAFSYDAQNGTLSYAGRINRKDVTMVYGRMDFEKPTSQGNVKFSDELFGDDLNSNFYNYCPTIIMEGNAIMHIWYCSNKTSGNVTDYVAYRRGDLQADGRWVFTEKSLVLQPTAGTWDERHTCDPAVVKGAFEYKGLDYSYLMAYLGCVTNDSSRNEIGIAVAQSPEGPWIKVVEANPIANYYESPEYVGDRWTWGYGQPSLVSVDQAGQVLLFYTKGIATGTFEAVELWDFSDLDTPVKTASAEVSNAGIVNAGGGSDVINNADFAYDPYSKRLYVVKEDFPYPTDENPTWVTASNTVEYINLGEETYPGASLFQATTLRWQKVGSIGPNETGFARVHNCGILTDPYGWLINPFQIPIVYTMSDLSSDYPQWGSGGQWPSLHTYRLHGYLLEI